MGVQKTGSPADPYTRLGEAKKQINLAIEECDEDADARELHEALTLIEAVLVEEQPLLETD